MERHDTHNPASTVDPAAFRAMAEVLPDGLGWFDRALRLGYANFALAAALGRAPHELLGRTPSEFTGSPEVASAWEEALEGVFASGAACDFECHGPAGGWQRVRLVPMDDARVLAMVTDAQPHHEREALLRATLEASADGILVIGTDGTIRTYNQRLLEMWHLSEEQLRQPRTAVPCMSGQLKDPDGFLARVRELYAQPEAESHDLLELKDGRIFERYSRPQRLGSTVVGRLWSYRDVTGVKRTEGELAQRARELEAANRDLEEADRYKEEFLAVISHELRTPLNCITGFGSVMESGAVGPVNQTQREYLHRMLGGAERMLGLVNNLLDVGRMRAGKFQLDPYETDYAPILEEVVVTMGPLAREKRLTIAEEIDLPCLVTMDAMRITQVLTNLLDNAIKFTPEGGRITLRAHVRDGQVVTEVRDSGPGIAPEDLPRLGVAFKQLDMGSTRQAQGAGLGLSICKSIVEAHRGVLEIESAPGAGSTFRFVIPLQP